MGVLLINKSLITRMHKNKRRIQINKLSYVCTLILKTTKHGFKQNVIVHTMNDANAKNQILRHCQKSISCIGVWSLCLLGLRGVRIDSSFEMPSGCFDDTLTTPLLGEMGEFELWAALKSATNLFLRYAELLGWAFSLFPACG